MLCTAIELKMKICIAACFKLLYVKKCINKIINCFRAVYTILYLRFVYVFLLYFAVLYDDPGPWPHLKINSCTVHHSAHDLMFYMKMYYNDNYLKT